MATNNPFKVTKDTSARKGGRIGSIQSAVEAAAVKESHDYYITRLNEGYKEQLETMEQQYEEQIKELKSQLVASAEKVVQEGKRSATLEARLLGATQDRDQALHVSVAAEGRAKKAEWEKGGIESRYRAQILEHIEKARKQEVALDKAHRERNTGPHRWIEVKFTRRLKSSKMAKSTCAVKRGSATFGELVKAATSSKTETFIFQHQGRRITDMDKSVAQVSNVLDS